jgi:hypothetical protein
MQFRTKAITAGMVLVAALAVFVPKVKAVALTYVQVLNSLAQWVPTGNIDEPGRNPVEVHVGVTSPNVFISAYAVPANRRFVIQQISADCVTQTDVVLGSLHTTVNGADEVAFFSSPNQFNLGFNQESVFSVPVHYYADPGTNVEVAVKALGAFNGSCNITLAGYLVNLDPPQGVS